MSTPSPVIVLPVPVNTPSRCESAVVLLDEFPGLSSLDLMRVMARLKPNEFSTLRRLLCQATGRGVE